MTSQQDRFPRPPRTTLQRLDDGDNAGLQQSWASIVCAWKSHQLSLSGNEWNFFLVRRLLTGPLQRGQRLVAALLDTLEPGKDVEAEQWLVLHLRVLGVLVLTRARTITVSKTNLMKQVGVSTVCLPREAVSQVSSTQSLLASASSLGSRLQVAPDLAWLSCQTYLPPRSGLRVRLCTDPSMS